MKDLFSACAGLLESNEDVVMVSIVEHLGSSPRKSGSKMLVRQDGAITGTIGGGLFEAQAIRAAREVFASGQTQVREFAFTGADATGQEMICGGKAVIFVDLLLSRCAGNARVCRAVSGLKARGQGACLVTRIVEGPEDGGHTRLALAARDKTIVGMPLPDEVQKALASSCGGRAPRRVKAGGAVFLCEPVHAPGTVYIFGAGHVSRSLAHLCSFAGFQTVVIDDRAEWANAARFPDAERIIVAKSMDACMDTLPVSQDSYLVIVTRGHAFDLSVLGQALKTDAGYIGMIGSKKKRDTIYQHLRRSGVTEEALARVHSPIGIAIASETPEEIAVSIVAELIDARAALTDA